MDSLKPVAFLLLLTCLRPSVSLYSQSTKPTVTLSYTNVTLEKILREIQRQTGFTYFLDNHLSGKARRVSISVTHAPVEEVLETIFRDQPLTYSIGEGNFIAVREKIDNNGIVILGRVTNEKDEPIPGATVQSRGRMGDKLVSTMTNERGSFVIRVSDRDTGLIFSSINYETRRIRLPGSGSVTVQLKDRVGELGDVAVVAAPNNGYQRFSKDRSTGSYATVDNTVITRKVSTNILERLDGVTSSLIFNKNIVEGTNQSAITIRGRSTIFANADPVVVIDNFPYSGDINNLNPDDVESITILKDAAAASIWGAFSGNGVIVITTKRGKYNQATKWNFNTSRTWGKKPNLFYEPILSSGDYVDMEQMLFGKGYYSILEQNSLHPGLSPAVEIMIKERDGVISQADAQAQLEALKRVDTRNDVSKYYYRHTMNSQYSLNFNGGGTRNSYYFSAGFDRNFTNQVRNDYRRLTFSGNNTYWLIPKKLEFTTGLFFTYSKTDNDNGGGNSGVYPYLHLADAQGEALSVPLYFRQSYLDTVGAGKLLDWNYRPLDELHNADNTIMIQDYRFNLGLKYTIGKGLEAQLQYQYGHGTTDDRKLYGLQSYFTRDLINQYTAIDSTGRATYGIPMGGILDEKISNYDANNVRFQLSYDHTLGEDHQLTAIAGGELRDVEMKTVNSRVYGYDDNRKNGLPVNYNTKFPRYNSVLAPAQIPYIDHTLLNSDRYLSYYTNAAYTYKGRYTVSGSARRDESNLFGVNTNRRTVPLWSAGVAWNIAKENFYRIDWLPVLRLRLTNGYNGNVDRAISAYTTALINTGTNGYGVTVASVNNPPNPNLRWERTHIVNIGVDFGTMQERFTGSLEYYIKSGRDLIGQIPVDPTTGNTVFTGNTANMLAHGVDLTLRTKNLDGVFKWNSIFLFGYVRDRVTDYSQKLGPIYNYLYPASISPLQGKPLYSVYAYKWMGLDAANGDPQGWMRDANGQNGHISKDYSSIENSTNPNDLVYKGPANPPFFGSVRNDFSWKEWGLSFNIVYKLGYYFRRNSIQYNNLFANKSKGHPDYDHRWMQPGDEKKTFVPSLVYPADIDRDVFYSNSEPLIEKGDHIRLQDIQLSYDLPKRSYARLPLQTVRFYCYANNIGIIWKANHQGIDPDYLLSAIMPNPRTIALGLKLGF